MKHLRDEITKNLSNIELFNCICVEDSQYKISSLFVVYFVGYVDRDYPNSILFLSFFGFCLLGC